METGITGWGYQQRLAAGLLLLALVSSQPVQAATFTKIADTTTPWPGGSGTFRDFNWGPSLQGGLAAFVGRGSDTNGTLMLGVFLVKDGQIFDVADTTTPVPGGGTFVNFQTANLQQGEVIFWSGRSQGGTGIYRGSGGPVIKLVDSDTPVPGDAGNFVLFSQPSICGDKLAFQGGPFDVTRGGVFLFENGALSLIANTSLTPVPGSPGHFTSFHNVWLQTNGIVVRAPSTTNTDFNDGIYLFKNGAARTLVDSHSHLPGLTNSALQFPLGATGDGISVVCEADDGVTGSALYRVRGSQILRIADLQTVAPNSTNLLVRFDPFLPFGEDVLFVGWQQDMSQGLYRYHAGVLTKLIASGDLLDQKVVRLLDFGPQALDGLQLGFKAWFVDRSVGLYTVRLEPVITAQLDAAINGLLLSWPDSATNYVLETAAAPAPLGPWQALTNGISSASGSFWFTNVLDRPDTAFYRLRAQ